MSNLKKLMEDNPEIIAHPAALLGLVGAVQEAHDEYGEEENYPPELAKFLKRAVEIAEEFIDELGVE